MDGVSSKLDSSAQVFLKVDIVGAMAADVFKWLVDMASGKSVSSIWAFPTLPETEMDVALTN